MESKQIASLSEECHLTAPSLNTTLQEEAISCVHINHGIFYDACSHQCYIDMNLLRLNQSLELEHFVYGYLFPILVILVVVANVLVALVLSQKHMVSPTNVVLKYMAIADLCVGLVPLPWTFFYHTLKNYQNEKQLELWWCFAFKYSMDAVPPVFHNISMWLAVLLAGQRFISIQCPLRSREFCSVRNVRIATIVISVIATLCGIPKAFDYHFDVYEGWAYTQSGEWVYMRSCLSGFTDLVKAIGMNAFFNTYFWTRVFGFIILPSTLLIILNALLIRGIRKAQQRKDRLLREKRAREAQRQMDSNSTSIMLVVIVSIFLVVNLPQALFMAMLCVCNTFGISNSLLEGVFPTTFLLVSNMLVMATYPINFGIYCFMSSSFRDTFTALFCKKQWQQKLGTQPVTQFTRASIRSAGNRYSIDTVTLTGGAGGGAGQGETMERNALINTERMDNSRIGDRKGHRSPTLTTNGVIEEAISADERTLNGDNTVFL